MNTELDILLENLQNVMIENVTDVANESAEALDAMTFDVLCAVSEGCGDSEFLAMMINRGVNDIRKNPEAAMEGATSESIKTLFSDDLKEAKSELKEATKEWKAGNNSAAASAVKSARQKFVKVHDNLAKVKQGPVSTITSGFASIVISPIATFKSLTAMSPLGKAALLVRGLVNAVSALVGYIPGLGLAAKSIISQVAKAGSGSAELGMMVKNKWNNIKKDPDKKGSGNDKIENKAAIWNMCQREMLYILKLYIQTCDGILKDIAKSDK